MSIAIHAGLQRRHARAGGMSFPRCVRVALVAAAALSCGDDPAGPSEERLDPPRPAAVAVTPARADFRALGETVRLAAEVRDQRGRVMDAATVTWSSSDSSVATVDTAGLVTAAGDGEAAVGAAAGTASGGARVTVAREVASVALTPSGRAVSVGDTLRLAAEARDEGGAPIPGAVFLWSSSDRSVATVDAEGLVRAGGEGAAVITAAAGTAAGAATIRVTDAGSDRAALVALYEAAGGPNWENNASWLTDAPLGQWHGVGTDDEGRVVSLKLRGNGLEGEIPPELGDLANLDHLILSSNDLEGEIPP